MNELAAVRDEALGKVAEAGDLATLESLRVAYLGKKGALTGVLKSLGKLPPEERPAAGAAVNAAKEEVQAALEV
jgi:phenylalanyl-tRNA synthetase alpha chain